MQVQTVKAQAMSLGRRLSLFLNRMVGTQACGQGALGLEALEARQMLSGVPVYVGDTSPIDVTGGSNIVLDLNKLFSDDGALKFNYSLSGTKSITNQTLISGQSLVDGVLTLNTQAQENGNITLTLGAQDDDLQSASASVVLEIHATHGVILEGVESTWTGSVASTVPPVTAALADGGFVNVWYMTGQGTYARVYNADGGARTAAFVVAPNASTFTGDNLAVTGLSSGGFVVAFADNYLEPGNTAKSNQIFVQRYDAAGNAVGAAQRPDLGATFDTRRSPALTALADDKFVVGWIEDVPLVPVGSILYDGYFQVFDSSGTVTGVTQLTGADSTGGFIKMATLSDGRFVVAWDAYGPPVGSREMYTQIFNPDGSADSAVAVVGGRVISPVLNSLNVAGLEGGGFVVVWSSAPMPGMGSATTLYSRVFTGSNTPLTAPYPTMTPGVPQARANVAAVAGGGYVIAWSESALASWGQAFTPSGVTQGGRFKIGDSPVSSSVGVTLAATTGGGFIATYYSGTSIRSQKYAYNAAPALKQAPRVTMRINSAPQTIDLHDYFTDDTTLAGDLTFTVVGSTNPETFDVQSLGGGLVQVSLLPNALGSGAITVKVQDETGYESLATVGLWSYIGDDAIVTAGDAAVVAGALTETLTDADVAVGPDGSYVVAWSQKDSASSSKIYARRFDAQGVALGGALLVNSSTTGILRQQASVSVGDDNTFVVAWSTGPSGPSSADIYARVFNASDAAVGAEFMVNTITLAAQMVPQVSHATNGEFVVSWSEPYVLTTGTDRGPHAQRFSKTGAKVGPELVIGTIPTSPPVLPGIFDIDPGDGSVRAVWGMGPELYTMRNDAGGTGTAHPLVVGTTAAAGYQVAVSANGSFVVVWGQVGSSSSDLYFQRFGADSVPLGAPQQVGATLGTYTAPNVGIAADGSFAISWTSKAAVTGAYSLFLQRFDADGDTLGAQMLINDPATTPTGAVDLSVSASGHIVASWETKDSASKYTLNTRSFQIEQAFEVEGFIPVEDPAPLGVDHLDIAFNQPVDVGSFDWSSYWFSREDAGGSTGLGGELTFTHVDGLVYRIAGLGNMTDAAGTYRFTLRDEGVTSALGRVLAEGAQISWTVELETPSAPVLTEASEGVPGSGHTTLATPRVTGTATPGATVQIYEGTVLRGTALADSQGVYNIQLTTLASGWRTLKARSTDGHGTITAFSGDSIIRVVSATPQISSITTFSAPRTSPVTTVTVKFAVGIDVPTLTWEDVTLTLDGGANLATSALTITQHATDPYSFVIGIPAQLTDDPGNYQLTVAGAGVNSLGDTAFANNKTSAWTMQAKILSMPVYGTPRTAALTTTTVRFSTQIDPATFTWQDLSLNLNGRPNTATSAITITQHATDPLTYIIGFPTALTEAPGSYQLTVLGAGIQTVSGVPFMNDGQTAWTMQARISSMPTYATPRATALLSTTVRFGTRIDAASLTWEDIVLTLNGGANLATSGITFTQHATDSLTYIISIPSELTDDPGDYQLTVVGAGIQALSGVAFMNDGQTGWTMQAKISSMPTYGTPRTTSLTSTTVRFGTQIDAASFTWEDLLLTRDGGPNLITSAITITRHATDPLLYIISMPAALTAAAGSYQLTVLGAGIQTVSGVSFINNGQTAWTKL